MFPQEILEMFCPTPRSAANMRLVCKDWSVLPRPCELFVAVERGMVSRWYFIDFRGKREFVWHIRTETPIEPVEGAKLLVYRNNSEDCVCGDWIGAEYTTLQPRLYTYCDRANTYYSSRRPCSCEVHSGNLLALHDQQGLLLRRMPEGFAGCDLYAKYGTTFNTSKCWLHRDSSIVANISNIINGISGIYQKLKW